MNIKGKCRKRIIKRMRLKKTGLDWRRRNIKQREMIHNVEVDIRAHALIVEQL